MSIPYIEAKQLWSFMANRFNIPPSIENKNKIYFEIMETYAKEFGGREDEVSRTTFVDDFLSSIEEKQTSSIEMKSTKNSLARIAGFKDYIDFLDNGYEKEEQIDFTDLPETIIKIFSTTGLTNAYPLRSSAKSDILKDISKAKSSIQMFSRVYFQKS